MRESSNLTGPARARALRALLCLLAVLALARAAAAEPVETIVNNGDPANRVDIVILGDGYTAAEMPKYRSDIQQFVQLVFEQEPLKEYQRFFNVHRIDVESAQSGSDHPERNSFRNTAFDSAYNCAGIQRLICANTFKASNVANASLAPAQIDLIILIVNDPEYGGSGGPIAIASTNQFAVELVLHESGHTFGLLADEYTSNPPPCNNTVEPPQANATRETSRDAVKWRAWIDPATPLPTFSTQPALVGLYEGARYCPAGLYRPTFSSKMRTLGAPFEQVNGEQLVRRVYNWVSPVDSFAPSNTTLQLTTSQPQTFAVGTPSPLTHSLAVSWTVDGRPAGTSPSLNVRAGGFGVGTHTVEATVRDQTAFVRSDPEQLLTERVSWSVNVSAANPADGSEFFVTQHYRDFLNREPDADGLRFWVQGIEACVVDAGCREVKRVDTSAAFFLSIEFQETGYLVYKTYKAAFGNLPGRPVPVRRADFLNDTRAIGSGVVVNVGDWRAQLEANKNAYALAFVRRADFQAAFPATMTGAEFVDRLFANANVTPAAGERDAALAAFGAGGDAGRAAALRGVAESAALHRAEFNRAFVLMQYFGYLQRNPDEAPEPGLNFDGYNFWLSKLEEFGGDYRRAEMVKAFISSIEYRHRFAAP
jgi:hypothetical protein